jgi:hypothetical protein
MADFKQNANVKSATGTFAEPIADIATFDMLRVLDMKQEKTAGLRFIVQSVITENPYKCHL